MDMDITIVPELIIFNKYMCHGQHILDIFMFIMIRIVTDTSILKHIDICLDTTTVHLITDIITVHLITDIITAITAIHIIIITEMSQNTAITAADKRINKNQNQLQVHLQQDILLQGRIAYLRTVYTQDKLDIYILKINIVCPKKLNAHLLFSY